MRLLFIPVSFNVEIIVVLFLLNRLICYKPYFVGIFDSVQKCQEKCQMPLFITLLLKFHCFCSLIALENNVMNEQEQWSFIKLICFWDEKSKVSKVFKVWYSIYNEAGKWLKQ